MLPPPTTTTTASTLGQAFLARFAFHPDDTLRPCGDIDGTQMGKLDTIETVSAARGADISKVKSDVWLRYREITESGGRVRRVTFEFSDSSEKITDLHNHPTFFELRIEESNIGQGGGSRFDFNAFSSSGVHHSRSFDLRDTDAIRCTALIFLAWVDIAKKTRAIDLPTSAK